MNRIALAMTLSLLSVGCVSSHSHDTGDNTPLYTIAAGYSTPIQPGVQAGYGITASAGGFFRIVWTGDARTGTPYREFTGTVHTAGTFTGVTYGCGADYDCSLEADDIVSAPVNVPDGQQITFDTIASDGVDGFDFSVDTEPVWFDLKIDGVRYPNLVNFPNAALGGASSTVESIPFELTE